MGNAQTMHKAQINFEQIQVNLQLLDAGTGERIMLSTLSPADQQCLIPGTITPSMEETAINTRLADGRFSKTIIIIYGRNCNDSTVTSKYLQLVKLGCSNVRVYSGGLFEWLMLQDIYGKESFPTTSDELDILRYK